MVITENDKLFSLAKKHSQVDEKNKNKVEMLF
jgi:hypothetical protein